MLPKELQILIDALPPKTQVLFKAVVSFYEGKLSELEVRIKELEDKDAKNSGNSSKPCLLYTSPSPRDATLSRMPSSA